MLKTSLRCVGIAGGRLGLLGVRAKQPGCRLRTGSSTKTPLVCRPACGPGEPPRPDDTSTRGDGVTTPWSSTTITRSDRLHAAVETGPSAPFAAAALDRVRIDRACALRTRGRRDQQIRVLRHHVQRKRRSSVVNRMTCTQRWRGPSAGAASSVAENRIDWPLADTNSRS